MWVFFISTTPLPSKAIILSIFSTHSNLSGEDFSFWCLFCKGAKKAFPKTTIFFPQVFFISHRLGYDFSLLPGWKRISVRKTRLKIINLFAVPKNIFVAFLLSHLCLLVSFFSTYKPPRTFLVICIIFSVSTPWGDFLILNFYIRIIFHSTIIIKMREKFLVAPNKFLIWMWNASSRSEEKS